MSVLTLYYTDSAGSPDEWNGDDTKTLARVGFTYDVAPAPVITVINRDASQVLIPTTSTITSYIASFFVVGVDSGEGVGSGLIYNGGVVGSGSITIPAGGSEDFQVTGCTITGMSVADINAGALGLQNYSTANPYPARIRWWIRQGGTRYLSALVTFTLAAPTVATSAATNLTSTTAQLNGTINPQGANSDYLVSYHFEYGLTAAYGTNTPTRTTTGSGPQTILEAIDNLSASTTYHFRLVATNVDNSVATADDTFTTTGAAAGASDIRGSNVFPRRRF